MNIKNIAASIANCEIVKNHIKKSSLNPKYLSRTLLLTSVSKDIFAYALRVHYTLVNDKIPEDKKQFSAKMDTASGILTGVFQIGTGFLVSSEKFQNFFADKLFKSIENPEDLKTAKSSFSALSTLVLASVFAKRILTPLFACVILDKIKSPKNENK